MARRTSPCAAVWLVALPTIFACACPATAATYTVTNTDDSGSGSLRQAIADANGNSGTDTIAFNLSGTGPFTITVHSEMVVNESVLIDGLTQSGSRANTLSVGSNASLLIVLDGANEDTGDDGYCLYLTAGGCTIRGLVFQRFRTGGVFLDQGTSGSQVYGCFFGTDASGATLQASGQVGIALYNSSANTIGGDTVAERNVICGGAGQGGVSVSGASSSGNLITGNYIGTDADGTAALGNYEGVYIYGSPDNTVGGTTAAERNVIAGNNDNGVYLAGSGATGNLVQGNYVGVGSDGTTEVANGSNGVYLADGSGNTIGGSTAGKRNVIGGNDGDGVRVNNSGASNTVIQGNYIGTNAAGTSALQNYHGVSVYHGADTTIGGATAGQGNLISGNNQQGIRIEGTDATGTLIKGNLIGTDVNGTSDLGNLQFGVYLYGSPSTTVGGTTAPERNVISGNDRSGVYFNGSASSGNLVEGNYIGTDINGTSAIGNTQYGVQAGGAPSNTIGGSTAAARNVISGNTLAGVSLSGTGATGNQVKGNYIGTDATGTADLGNTGQGVWIDGAASNTVGGVSTGDGNVISGNNQHGVYVYGSGATGNLVAGNYIGTNAAGAGDLGNTYYGVYLNAAPSNTIGGTTSYQRNVISGNDLHGVYLYGAGATGNVISGNYIGLDANGTADLGNAQQGIYLYHAPANTIGGTTAADRNIISGNDQSAVYLTGAGSTGNVVSGNYLGTNAAGSGAVPNLGSGVYLQDAPSNTIGGTTAGERNVLSGNNSSGVILYGSGTTGNVVEGNYIGTNAAGTADLGNARYGLDINTAQNNTVGGDTAAERNIISGNDLSGILVFGSSTTGNVVAGNYIGTDVNGTTDLGNTQQGVLIDRAPGNTVGGRATGEGNVISGNDQNGVYLANSTATGNLVAGNTIGLTVGGTAALGNYLGVHLNGAPNNTVGGTTAAERNVVSGNDTHGVYISGSGATGNVVRGNHIGTDANGTADLGNASRGVLVEAATSNTIGGTTAADRNLISGNGLYGVNLYGPSTSGNLVAGNYIGTDVNGTAAVGNSASGVELTDAPSNTIGGDTAGERNVIAGNDGSGVVISGSTASGNSVSGNYIGTNAAGTGALGNTDSGVLIDGSSLNTVGGSSAAARNVISGNTTSGVRIYGAAASENTISANYIGTDATGAADLGNGGHGVYIDVAPSNTIGGTTAGERNVISGNDLSGSQVYGSTATNNVVLGNHIGTNAAGTAGLANSGYGLFIYDAPNNTVGGPSAAARNVISGNGQAGVYLFGSGTAGSMVSGNYIGTNAAGTASVPNTSYGVSFDSSVTNVTLGGTTAGAGNVISGNGSDGVLLNATASGITIAGNYIGTTAAGTGALGNTGDGIRADGGSSDHTITDNVISANNNGIGLQGGGDHLITGNLIGTNAAGTGDLGNTGLGVYLDPGVSSTTIGGTTTAARNVVSGNGLDGIAIRANSNTVLIQGNYIGTDLNGTGALGNDAGGITFADTASNNTVGGTATGEANLIAHNGTVGIGLASSMTGTGNRLRGNSIHDNGSLGIDIGLDGVTANDPTDGDTGPNLTQNYPDLDSATQESGQVTIAGSFQASQDVVFPADIDFYVNAGGGDEGQTYLGSFQATSTDFPSPGTFSASFAARLSAGDSVTATATDANGNTSEFSGAVTVTAPVASKLGFVTQPADRAGNADQPDIQVQVLTPGGNRVTSSTATISLALGTNGSGAALSGTLTAAAVNGVATFTGLRVDKVGADLTIVASSTGLTDGTSDPFDITAPVVTTTNDTGSDSNTVARTADLAVTKTNDLEGVAPGQLVPYTIVVSNRGPADVGGATLTDDFDPSSFGGGDDDFGGFDDDDDFDF